MGVFGQLWSSFEARLNLVWTSLIARLFLLSALAACLFACWPCWLMVSQSETPLPKHALAFLMSSSKHGRGAVSCNDFRFQLEFSWNLGFEMTGLEAGFGAICWNMVTVFPTRCWKNTSIWWLHPNFAASESLWPDLGTLSWLQICSSLGWNYSFKGCRRMSEAGACQKICSTPRDQNPRTQVNKKRWLPVKPIMNNDSVERYG